ncbi:protein LSM14 homolog car-1 isoform X2 [Parasteatoda tepidariorum]|uniref:protein LSM14 homolog car-1 isoform X2 n=1 Tax=Parasteatoda tepidariorum TaxID=114398 RepID=UPI001C726088|nr:protein LSM14 homolog B isoform X2 [Parasteatoda tepidariorum]
MSSPLPPYLGSKISIISKSEIRYEGILYTVDPKESTIALAKVKSFGTEGRPTERPLAPRDEVYEYIIFRASDIKDLHVCEGPKSFHGFLPHDPAIVSSGPVMHYPSGQGYNTFYGITGLQGFPSHVGNNYSNVHPFNVAQSSRATAQTPQRKGTTTDASVQVSVGSTDVYNRQGLDGREPLRQRNQMNYPQRRRASFNRQPGGPRRNSIARRNPRNESNIENYDKEYDFEQANAEFQELENKLAKNSIGIFKLFSDLSLDQSPSVLEDQNSSYDKEKSFFDDISCEATQISKGFPRFDWRLERKLNVETFGASANNAWLRRRRGRGNMRRGYNRMNEVPKTVTFDEKPVVKEVDTATEIEEVKSDQLPIIEVVMDKEKSEWPENKVETVWN